MKTVYTLAVSLPTPGFYLSVQNSFAERNREWGEAELEKFLSLRESVAETYALKDGHPDKVPPLYVSGVSVDQAVARMIPLALDVSYSHKRPGNLISEKGYHLNVVGHVAGRKEKGGVLLTLISKEPGTLQPTPELQTLIEPILRGRDFNTLEMRSSRAIIAAASSLDRPFEGAFRLVAVPANRTVRLTRNSQGEYITEVPEVWA